VFHNACATGQCQYQDAYTAIVCNPLPSRALECLRRLVALLCEEKQVAVLCSLPFAGTLVLEPANGASEPVLVELADEVARMLTRRAHNSDLAADPQPYQVLYSFLVKRSDYSGAAAAMLAYARRLRSEADATPASVSEVLRGYGAALGALSQLPAAEAWLSTRSHILAPLAAGAPAVVASARGHEMTPAAAAASKALDPRAQLAEAAVTLEALQREYLLFSAAAKLWGSGNSSSSSSPMAKAGPQAVFQSLLVAGQYDLAISLAQACFAGPALAQGLEEVVRALAAQCVRVQVRGGADGAAALDVWEAAPGGWRCWWCMCPACPGDC
jgi:hypothetical protein